MIRTFLALQRVDPGFSGASKIETVRIGIPDTQVSDPEKVIRMEEAILRKMETIACVARVGAISAVDRGTALRPGAGLSVCAAPGCRRTARRRTRSHRQPGTASDPRRSGHGAGGPGAGSAGWLRPDDPHLPGLAARRSRLLRRLEDRDRAHRHS